MSVRNVQELLIPIIVSTVKKERSQLPNSLEDYVISVDLNSGNREGLGRNVSSATNIK